MTLVRVDATSPAAVRDRVVELFVAYRGFYGRTTPDDERAGREFIRRRLEQHDSFVWAVLGPGGDVAGFVQVYPQHSSLGVRTLWWLNDLFVDPSARSSGVGRVLVAGVLEQAERLGVAEVRLETLPDNLPARALYESLSFEADPATASDFLTYARSTAR